MLNAKIKPAKISSGRETGFSRKFGPAKISCYMVFVLKFLCCVLVPFSLTPAPPRKPLSTSPAKPVSGASRLQRKPQQAASRLPAGGRTGGGGGGGGLQKAAGGGASASELRAAEEEIKRLNTQVGPHIWSSVQTLLHVPV